MSNEFDYYLEQDDAIVASGSEKESMRAVARSLAGGRLCEPKGNDTLYAYGPGGTSYAIWASRNVEKRWDGGNPQRWW